MMTASETPAPETAPPAAVVILNWNQPDLTRRCLTHVHAQDYPNQRVVVVDNGSRPAGRVVLEPDSPAELVQLPANLGFAGGMNAGIRHALAAGAEYVWLLNNDAFPGPDCLTRLVAAVAEAGDIAAATPALFSEDGGEQHCGSTVDWRTLEMVPFLSAAPAPDGFGKWLVGTAPLFRAAALRAAGGFDARYFAYMEEVDLFLRCQRLGYRSAVVPAARCLHLGSASTGGDHSPTSVYLITRNAWLLWARHPHRRGGAARALALVTGGLADVYADLTRGWTARARARLLGLTAGLRREIGPPRLLHSRSPLQALAAAALRRCPYRILAAGRAGGLYALARSGARA